MIGRKAKAVPSLSFEDRLAVVKTTLISAYNEAENLFNDMQNSIDDDSRTIDAIQSRINCTKKLQADTENYMNKLKEFI